MTTTVNRQCTLCEAHCGIRVEVDGRDVVRITGDPDDHRSQGYICPKAAALADLYEDPDRLRAPVRRTADGWEQIGWDEAIAYASKGIRDVARRHGDHAVANYLGNPGAHTWSLLSFVVLRLAMASRNNYSVSSADQLPQHVVATEMLGNPVALPIPDIDRTTHMLVLGANPAVSNGSVLSAPGMRDRLRAITGRGGKVVVVDPRRTETTKLAAEHLQVRPGGDPFLLLGMLHVVFAEGLEDLGRVAAFADGLEELRVLASAWPPERVAELTGIDAGTIARTAREFAAADRAAAYGRVGVCHQTTGSVTHWLITVLNAVTGNLDREGGAMFTNSVVDATPLFRILNRLGIGAKLHRTRRQRVSGYPDALGEFPVAGLPDEILTPGRDQVRGLVIYAGNPVLSAPGGRRLDTALEDLEFMVAIDSFVTETTRHANVILPAVSPLERDDLDLVIAAFSNRNHVRFNPKAVPPRPGGREDWEVMNDLARGIGRGRVGRPIGLAVALLSKVGLAGPSTLAQLAVLTGPHGVLRRGPRKGLTLGRIRRQPHGIDLGPLEPRLPGVLTTPDRRLHLAPAPLLREAGRLDEVASEKEDAAAAGFDMTLIGRRSVRSNNSWLHNSRRLMKGRDRCTALVHPDDAAARGLQDGDAVRVTSRIGSIELPVDVSDEILPGVVSIPHGFGHGRPGVGWKHAATKPGVSVNDITDPGVVDRLTGTAAFNAVPVRVEVVSGDAVAQDAAADRAVAGAPGS
ncbi:molybdopterin oxidoreductase family protein [Patulibacter sp.]|uniref:molybdopterin oxidoreductase family protein n=1 Tax=Patulibacter sp. TaxID=1912859 RepID=UPI0027179919|nr:molybdopterin oxidoreductase family protein [Patulibacter sp.]MDO9409374.1 molybdopterin oxidoreductase family protein [Patulibacter sp.]